jgi:hypothetical protein
MQKEIQPKEGRHGLGSEEQMSDIKTGLDDQVKEATVHSILQNEELVGQIKESAANLSEPMTITEFIEWLQQRQP